MVDASTSPTPFDGKHYFELMQTAYSDGNYEDVYRYAKTTIEHMPKAEVNPVVWTYRGIAAGMLSTPQKPRIDEMVSCIRRTLELQGAPFSDELAIKVAEKTSYALVSFTFKLIQEMEQIQESIAEGRAPRSITHPGKDFTDDIAIGLGAGLADGMNRVAAKNKAAKELGNQFRSDYQQSIVRGVNFAWSLTQSSRNSANSLHMLYRRVMETLCLDTDTILSFQEQVFQTTDQIRNKYPELAEALKAEKKKKNCYVATAVMGDYDHPYVLILREFRDKRLLATAHGRLFVRIYYQVGPITASMIARSEFLRVLSLRLLIIPATKFAQKALSQRP